jgi:Protein of unknown function DUF262/Protein of unknown function (DUF1524)
MQPSYSSIGQVFSAQMRYTVPLFQRPYVWNKEEQWQPLWDDLRALADRVFAPPSHKPVAGHFLGTVVLEQVPTVTVVLPERQVIDGQQRLTTLQLLLKAAQHALEVAGSKTADTERAKFDNAAGQISQLTLNQFTSTQEERFKVWPTNEDRAPFSAVMTSQADQGAPQGSRMADAYAFFRAEILHWLAARDAGQRAQAFAAALRDHLRIIVLDLDDNDEPQAIFETLNAHGTPLLPADLMKNWLLWEAGKASAGALYQNYWQPFDRDHEYWRKIVGTGHAARPRVDTFLQNWLMMRTREPVAVKHLYDRFLAYASRLGSASEDGLDVESLMRDIADSAERYRDIEAPSGHSELAASLRRLLRLDFVVFRPVLMALLERATSSAEDKANAVGALESFLVRRMICNMQTRGYGTLAIDLLKAIAAAPADEPITRHLAEALQGEPGSTSEWPSDANLRHCWQSRRFYGWLRRDRVLMILQAIEEFYQRQSTKAEPILSFDFSQLTIEHVMPQSWSQYWPLPAGGDISRREDAIQNIGNLTLVSGRLNPSLSNAAWVSDGGISKREELNKHSKLELNRRLLSSHPNHWNETAISDRALEMFDAARAVWRSGYEFLSGGDDGLTSGGSSDQATSK